MKTICLFFGSAILLTCCKPKEVEIRKEIKDNPNCAYTRNELNPVGKPVLMVEDALFISIVNEDTSANAKKGFNNDIFKGYLSCMRIDTVMGVYLNFKIYSADAWRDYGMIRKDNKISFILASGKTVTVPFVETFSGNTNLTSEMTEYKTVANISAEQAELLKSAELARVTISWTKREEEYKVVNPGIFISQIPCVE